MQPDDPYPFIRLWGNLVGESEQRIKWNIQEAMDEEAPNTAIFKSNVTGAWWTFEDIEREETKKILLRWKNGS
jgi:Mg/Co/Ni transporter MgtE